MQSLREVQIQCREAFLTGNALELSGLARPDRSSSVTGVRVYLNNARETARLALAASYPVVEDLVGPDCFAGLAAKYSKTHPSSEPDLQIFGERFPDFLQEQYSGTEHDYLADVARLELAAEQVLLRRAAAPLEGKVLAEVPEPALPNLRFVRSPAAYLVTSAYPILDIWRMHHRDPARTVSLQAGPSRVLVVRDSGNAVLRALSPLEYELAHRLSMGQRLGDVFEALGGGVSASGFTAALFGLLRCRIFVDIDHS